MKSRSMLSPKMTTSGCSNVVSRPIVYANGGPSSVSENTLETCQPYFFTSDAIFFEALSIFPVALLARSGVRSRACLILALVAAACVAASSEAERADAGVVDDLG